MNSRATKKFWALFRALPGNVQEQARAAYERWRIDPGYSSLRFKQVHPSKPLYSVRIGDHWRAVGTRTGDTITWFWIGSHAEYDRLISKL